MNALARRNRYGFALIVISASMLAVGLLGTALLSSITSARYERIHAGTSNRAYYLAESGASYVRSVRRVNPAALPAGTYTMENGDRFSVTVTAITGGILVESVGTANPGSYFESQRRIRFEMMDAPAGSGLLPLSFAELEKFIAVGVDPNLRSTGPSGHVLALDLKGDIGRFYLSWRDNPDLDLESAWLAAGNLLSYDVQMKVSPIEGGAGFGNHYMLGLSFRLNPDNQKSYGLSYFRSITDKKPPAWVSSLPASMQALRDGDVYLVLWYSDTNGLLTLLNYRHLTSADPVISANALIPYSTMLLSLKDVVKANGSHENQITAYIQSAAVYPAWPSLGDVDQAKWQEATNIFPHPVVWADGSVIQTNSLISSAHITSFEEEGEIGVHSFYDSEGANKKFFADFAMRLQNPAGSSGGGGTQIQY